MVASQSTQGYRHQAATQPDNATCESRGKSHLNYCKRRSGGMHNEADDQAGDRPDAPSNDGTNKCPPCWDGQGTRPHWELVHTPILTEPHDFGRTGSHATRSPLTTLMDDLALIERADTIPHSSPRAGCRPALGASYRVLPGSWPLSTRP